MPRESRLYELGVSLVAVNDGQELRHVSSSVEGGPKPSPSPILFLLYPPPVVVEVLASTGRNVDRHAFVGRARDTKPRLAEGPDDARSDRSADGRLRVRTAREGGRSRVDVRGDRLDRGERLVFCLL